MKVIFRCDAGKTHGLGRLTRSLALARAFVETGATPVFAVFGESTGLLAASGFKTVRLSEGRGPEHLRTLAELSRGADVVVVDSGLIDSLELVRLNRSVDPAKVIVIDDRGDRYITASAIVNPNISAYRCRYETSFGCKMVLGAPFALVRPDLAESAPNARPEENDVPGIVIAMGAFDAKAQTKRLLRILDQFDEKFSITVVMDRGAPTFADVEDRVRGMKPPTTLEASCARTGDVFAGAALAVCAGGTTALELAALGVPAAYLSETEHDLETNRLLEKNRAGLSLGYYGTTNDEKLARGLAVLLANQPIRDEFSRNGPLLVDGKGAGRVLTKLSKYGVVTLMASPKA